MRRRGKKKAGSKPAQRARSTTKPRRAGVADGPQQPFGKVEQRATRGKKLPALSHQTELAILRWMFDDGLTPRAPEHLH